MIVKLPWIHLKRVDPGIPGSPAHGKPRGVIIVFAKSSLSPFLARARNPDDRGGLLHVPFGVENYGDGVRMGFWA